MECYIFSYLNVFRIQPILASDNYSYDISKPITSIDWVLTSVRVLGGKFYWCWETESTERPMLEVLRNRQRLDVKFCSFERVTVLAGKFYCCCETKNNWKLILVVLRNRESCESNLSSVDRTTVLGANIWKCWEPESDGKEKRLRNR